MKDPRAQANIALRVDIGVDGSVVSAGIERGTAQPDLARCLVQACLSAQFDPPPGGSASIQIPLNLSSVP